MDFKERIFQARKAKGFSQEDLAELVGVSRQAVSKWETGEAMPDMERLIALCDALEQNIEYLALGKESAVPVGSVKKTHRWIAALLAVVCLVSGFLLGYYWPSPQMQTPVAADRNLSYRDPTGLRISDVTVSPVARNSFEVAILPVLLTEGLEVEVLCEDLFCNKSETLACAFDGNYYRVTLSRPEKYHYYLTVVLTDNGVKTQFPLLEIDGDRSVFSAIHLWETSQ